MSLLDNFFKYNPLNWGTALGFNTGFKTMLDTTGTDIKIYGTGEPVSIGDSLSDSFSKFGSAFAVGGTSTLIIAGIIGYIMLRK